ncbi:hypothetical protein PV04_03455 [Phialophora macrospora]|uniref:Uncharacterized protein n=1 Tax=Phialophora macrospora TaxID=1851006 RepID=A0A0D2EAC2_9EURO|nr:hypothetical protein PV04_03455 [Phialophora macrospora]
MRFCIVSISFPILLLSLLFFLTVTCPSAKKDAPPPSSSILGVWQIWRSAVKKAMSQTHIFIPPSHPYIHYVGRWAPSADHLAYETDFQGAYFEMFATNTTSVYLVFFQHPEGINGPRPGLNDKYLSLTVEINDNLVLGIRNPFSLVQVAEMLDPSKTYKLRITQMCSPLMHHWRFEGVWLDRPPSPVDGPSPIDPVKSAVGTTLGTLVSPTEDPYGALQLRDSPPLGEKPLIELYTSELDLMLYKFNPRKDAAGLAKERVDNWYNRLGSELGADIALIPTGEEHFSKAWYSSGDTGVADIFFGKVRYSSKSRWSFKSYRPAVLILQLGLSDILDLDVFSGNPRGGRNVRQRVDRFLDCFVKDYVKFVKTIRTVAYPSDGTTANPLADDDGSYIYNSAPSTLPIFLIVPFSAHRISVTRKLTIHKLMSDALARVVSALRAEGDTSTHYIDTVGWLDRLKDFEGPLNFRRWEQPGRKDWRPLTDAAKIKVASMLASHICSYIKPTTGESSVDGPAGNGSAVGPAFGDCAFDRYDSYLGNVYVPEGVELDRALLERKIEIIKGSFRIATPA